MQKNCDIYDFATEQQILSALERSSRIPVLSDSLNGNPISTKR